MHALPIPHAGPRARLLLPLLLVGLGTACAHPDRDGGGSGSAPASPPPNTPPSVDILEPADDVQVRLGNPLEILLTADDPDSEAEVFLWFDADGDPGTTADQTLLAGPLAEADGAEIPVSVDTTGMDEATWTLVATATDGASTTVIQGPRVDLVDNVAPTLVLTDPAGDFCRQTGQDFTVTVVADDPDDVASFWIVLDLDGDPATSGDQVEAAGPLPEADGAAVSVTVSTAGVAEGTWFILGRIEDALYAPVWAAAEGRLTLSGSGCPPSIVLTEPAEDTTVRPGETVRVGWIAEDPDSVAEVTLLADADGSPATEEDQVFLAGPLPEEDGVPASLDLDLAALGVPEGTWSILGIASDGEHPDSLDFAPGRVTLVADEPGLLEVLDPAEDLTWRIGDPLELRVVAEDPDDEGSVSLFLDGDGNAETSDDRIPLAGPSPEEDGELVLTADTTGLPEGSWFVLGVLESRPGVETLDFAPARLCLWSEIPPPGITATAPAADLEIEAGEAFLVSWIAEDDGSGLVEVWADADGDASTSDDRLFLGGPYASGGGEEVSVEVGSAGLEPGTWSIAVRIDNGSPCAPVEDLAPGRVTVLEPNPDCGIALGGFHADTAAAVAVLPDGSLAVAGSFEKTAEFGSFTLKSLGKSDVWVARISPDCEVLWAVQAGGFLEDQGLDVAVDAEGGILVSGSFTGEAVFGGGEAGETVLSGPHREEAFVARFFDDGTLDWARAATGPNADLGTCVAALPDGSVALGGWFQKTLTIEDQTVQAGANVRDAFVAVFDGMGNLRWLDHAGGAPGSTFANDLAALGDGTVVMTGGYLETALFGAGTPQETVLESVAGTLDVFLAAWEADGAFLWARTAGGDSGDEGLGLHALADGTLLVGGLYQTDAVFGPGEANETVLSVVHADDAFWGRWEANGDLLWVAGGGGIGWDSTRGVGELPDGGLLVTGMFEESITVDGTTLLADGVNDSFLLGLDPDGALRWLVRAPGAGDPRLGTTGVAGLPDLRVAACGQFSGSTSLGGVDLDSHGASDAFLLVLQPEDGGGGGGN